MRSILAYLCVIQLASSLSSDSLIGVLPPAIRDSPAMQVGVRETERLIGVRNMKDGKGRASSDEFVGLLSAFKKMSGGGLQTPRRTRKISQTQEYCSNNRDYYLSYCMGMLVDRDEATRDFLFRFCPWYENKCLHNDR